MIQVSCYRQSDSGEGWIVAQDGVIVRDATQRSLVARAIATDLSIGDGVRFGISSRHNKLIGWLLPDNKDNFGRNSTTGFLVQYDKTDLPQDICSMLMSNLMLLNLNLSREMETAFLDAVRSSLTRRRRTKFILSVIVFVVLGLAILSILGIC